MKIGHVHLKVRHIGRSEDFYLNVLGAQRTEDLGEQYSFLSMGEAHHEIALQQIGDSAGSPSSGSVGLYHTAFQVADGAELLRAIERLEERRIDYALVDHGISWAVYTADPDGNGVELFLDRRGAPSGRKLWAGLSRTLSKKEIQMSLSS